MAESVPLVFRAMTRQDLPHVAHLEAQATDFPWTEAQLEDCLEAGYQCLLCCRGETVLGYAVLSLVLDELSLLNFCIAVEHQGQGLGKRFLSQLLAAAAGAGVAQVFLEVRVSNLRAIGLYEGLGFRWLARRRDYYPLASGGREDALIYVYRFEASEDGKAEASPA